ncbi:MAG TPA: hypothetical protein VFQ61_23230 [Polyangiaceae bacterium]|nr:hypothetical protein [Polyangiaceae bacterium]
MATQPKPAPWGDINDFRDELFEWLVREGYSPARSSPAKAALLVQKEGAELPALATTVAQALYRVECFRGTALSIEGSLSPRLKEELTPEQYSVFIDRRREIEAERRVRKLQTDLELIKRDIVALAKRSEKRLELQLCAPHIMKPSLARVRVRRKLALYALGAAREDALTLHTAVCLLAPKSTRYAPTLAGWRKLEKELRATLAKADFPMHLLPKE